MMRTMVSTALAAAALVVATAAMAQASGPSNTLAPAAAEPPAPSPGMPHIKIVPAGPGAAMPVAATGEKTICKSSVVTGSLMTKRKTCLTAKQWDYVRDENERFARDFVHDNTSRPGGN